MPHSAETVSPQCGETTPIERAINAFGVLLQGWLKAADALPKDRSIARSAKELALEIHRSLQREPDLVGRRLVARAIRRSYPLFCRSLGVAWPPPYKDFAKELARLMPRKRIEVWRDGIRVDTQTVYLVPEPDTEVAALAIEKRRRA